MNRDIYSEKELKLYDYIVMSVKDITVELIKTELGEEYLGALGKLLRDELIDGNKKNVGTISNLNPYGRKWTKCYTIKEEKE